MYVLGISGGPNLMEHQLFELGSTVQNHDSAAVLTLNGKVVAAVEEERLDRIKHSNLFPVEAAKFCLEQAGITLAQVDKIAFYLTEEFIDTQLENYQGLSVQKERMWKARELLEHLIGLAFGQQIESGKLVFVEHHLAHAFSTFPFAAGKEALVVVLDGYGEHTAGLIGRSVGNHFEKLGDIHWSKSLGIFYITAISFISLKVFEEYKAMGLAPYGDPAVYRDLFASLITLREEGQFDIQPVVAMREAFAKVIPDAPDRNDLQQCHCDFAAALQEALEIVVFHILRHWQKVTGLEHLCLAGGVAHNSTMNGKILMSNLFNSIFVQPAAHDSGCALGAALYVTLQHAPDLQIPPFDNVYWGPAIPGGDAVESAMSDWFDWLEFRMSGDVVAETAEYLRAGEVVGWVQGASEFGPRALGNRSIIADPRPAQNRARINMMIKKREGFRPFAPSVIEEVADTYFEFGNATCLPYMSYVVRVRDSHQGALGAVTHVDGTARVQTVSKQSNPRYWGLLQAFGEHSGVPILLNTSFNNNVEPIVNSVDDAISCFLTTGLDRLVVGDYIAINRTVPLRDKLRNMRIRIVPHAYIANQATDLAGAAASVGSALAGTHRTIGQATYHLLQHLSDNQALTFERAMTATGTLEDQVCEEIISLWEKRLIRLEPARRAAA